MSYSPISGYTPLTREQMLNRAFTLAKNAGYKGDMTEFMASNTHTFLSNVIFPAIENSQNDIVTIFSNIFNEVKDAFETIQVGNGASTASMLKLFSAICDGVYLTNKTLETSLNYGEVGIYLDNLKDENQSQLQSILQTTAWLGMVTNPSYDDEANLIPVDVTFNNGQTFSYKVFNLKPQNYKQIMVKVVTAYKANTVRYNDIDIANYVQQKFTADLIIGKSLYPDSFLDASDFPSLASLSVKYSTDGTTWLDTILTAKPYERLTIKGNILVEVV